MKRLLKNFSIFAFVVTLFVCCNNNSAYKAKQEEKRNQELRESIVSDIDKLLDEKLGQYQLQLDSLKQSDVNQDAKISKLEKEIASVKKMIAQRDKTVEARLKALEQKTSGSKASDDFDLDAFIKEQIEDDLRQNNSSPMPIAKQKAKPHPVAKNSGTLYPIFLDAGNGSVTESKTEKSCAYRVEKKGHMGFITQKSDAVITFSLLNFKLDASKEELSKIIMEDFGEFTKQYGKPAAAIVFIQTSKALKSKPFLKNLFEAIGDIVPTATLIFPNFGSVTNAKQTAEGTKLKLIIADNLVEEASDHEYVLRKAMEVSGKKGKAVVLINASPSTVRSFEDFVSLNEVKTERISLYQ
ncbi:MAG: hypothetical protein PHE89_07465 [Alphaproteobacteria bacterium]|nr:hypothetical protein [Alphaproteobacteria bacterium]